MSEYLWIPALSVAAIIWGFFSVYWHLLEYTLAIDNLADRTFWSFAFEGIAHRLLLGSLFPDIWSLSAFWQPFPEASLVW